MCSVGQAGCDTSRPARQRWLWRERPKSCCAAARQLSEPIGLSGPDARATSAPLPSGASASLRVRSRTGQRAGNPEVARRVTARRICRMASPGAGPASLRRSRRRRSGKTHMSPRAGEPVRPRPGAVLQFGHWKAPQSRPRSTDPARPTALWCPVGAAPGQTRRAAAAQYPAQCPKRRQSAAYAAPQASASLMKDPSFHPPALCSPIMLPRDLSWRALRSAHSQQGPCTRPILTLTL